MALEDVLFGVVSPFARALKEGVFVYGCSNNDPVSERILSAESFPIVHFATYKRRSRKGIFFEYK
jgi:hypothetical protein